MSLRFSFLAILASLFAGSIQAAQAEPKAIVELFTSQGCSASLKADKLTAELAAKGEVILLTLPVDYWDYLGWKDTYGSVGNTARQRAYARARSDRKVFTPQIVVNGIAPAVANNRSAIQDAVQNGLASANPFKVPVSARAVEGHIQVEVGAGHATEDAEVWLFAISNSRTVQITAGQNRNHQMTYINVVRRMTRLGIWDGRAAHFSLSRAEALPADADRYMVLVQSGSGSLPGPILGMTSN
jgi:hypothetical protein